MLTTIGTVLLTVGAYGLFEKFFLQGKTQEANTWKQNEQIPDAVEVD